MIKHIYDELAHRWCQNGGTIYIYSDPHFADDEMKYLRDDYIGDEEQVKRINSKIGKNDTIIFLGDIGDVSFIKQIKGYKVLIMGNHDTKRADYLRVVKNEAVDVEDYLPKSPNDICIEAMKEYPNDNIGQEVYMNEYYKKAHQQAREKLKSVDNFYKLDGSIINSFKRPFMAWIATYDNRLFDEVYEGPVFINDRLILSHEQIEGLPSYFFNIHGHDHSNWYQADNHLNVCAELVDYTPVNLTSLLKNGLLKDTVSIHRATIDRAVERKLLKR